MIDLFAVLRALTLPGGASAGQPRIVIGPDLPPPLDTYSYFGFQFDSAIIFWGGTASNDDYSFLGHVQLPAEFLVIFGHVVNGAVIESAPGRPAGQSWSFRFDGHVIHDFELGNTAGDLQINRLSVARGVQGANVSTAGTVASTGGGEVAVASPSYSSEPIFVIPNDRIWRITANFGIYQTAGGDALAVVRVREGQATTLGTQLLFWNLELPSATYAGLVRSKSLTGYIKNTSGAAVNTKLSLTIQFSLGGGNVALYGDTNIPIEIVPEDYCAVSDHFDLASALVSV